MRLGSAGGVEDAQFFSVYVYSTPFCSLLSCLRSPSFPLVWSHATGDLFMLFIYPRTCSCLVRLYICKYALLVLYAQLWTDYWTPTCTFGFGSALAHRLRLCTSMFACHRGCESYSSSSSSSEYYLSSITAFSCCLVSVTCRSSVLCARCACGILEGFMWRTLTSTPLAILIFVATGKTCHRVQ